MDSEDTKPVKALVSVIDTDIYFNGPIDMDSMSKLTSELVKLESKIMKESRKIRRKIDELKDLDNDLCTVEVKFKPIYLYITSGGGVVHQALAVYDLIRDMRVPVYTVCKGFVASAATLISMAGKKRFITPNSYMLIHQISSTHWGKFSQISDQYENSRVIMEHLKRLYTEHTKIGLEELDEILKHDISWSAPICLEKGLVTELFRNLL